MFRYLDVVSTNSPSTSEGPVAVSMGLIHHLDSAPHDYKELKALFKSHRNVYKLASVLRTRGLLALVGVRTIAYTVDIRVPLLKLRHWGRHQTWFAGFDPQRELWLASCYTEDLLPGEYLCSDI